MNEVTSLGHGTKKLVVSPDEAGSNGAKPAKRVADKVIELAESAGLKLFVTPTGDTYGRFRRDKHYEVWRINSNAFKNWIRDLYYEKYNQGYGTVTTDEVMGTLGAKAYHDGKKADVFIRLAYQDGNIYLDLANDDWKVVEISATGWEVLDISPVMFRRTKGMLPLPTPQRGGDINELGNFIHFETSRDKVLTIAWIIGAYHPTGPYPVYVQVGEQGAGKSTRTRILGMLIDPRVPAMRSGSISHDDINIWTKNSWVISYDNLSNVTPSLSDKICTVSTGGGSGKRKLYEDDEETLFDAKRPQTLNGISELATRGDLLRRAVLSYPKTPDVVKPESQIYAEFEKAQPRLLGAVLDGVTSALMYQDVTHLEDLPSMADFAIWVTAAEDGLGWDDGTFMTAYRRNLKDANALTLEGSTLATELIKFMDSKYPLSPFSGTAESLLKQLNEFVQPVFIPGNYSQLDPTKDRAWPKTASRLGSDLNRIAPAMRTAGFNIEKKPGSNGGPRVITISRYSSDSNPNVLSLSKPA